MKTRFIRSAQMTVLAIITMWCFPFSGYTEFGLSLDGDLKYGPDFQRFDYVSKHAAKGGQLVLHSEGSFDKMNPFTLKGTAPEYLEALIYEPLAQASLDEPFSQYGLLAQSIEIADDGLSLTFRLRGGARFSDDVQVTADDVVYTIDILKSDQVHPFYPYYYADIERAEAIDTQTVRIHFKKKNRELPMIVGQIPILPKHVFAKQPFAERSLTVPIGSGPYTVASFAQGKSITYRRNPNYWAADLPVRRGMYNFDTIIVKYYKDQTVALEAFKAGEFDVMPIAIAKQWARDIAGPKVSDGSIKKGVFAHHNNAGMQGFVMNTRRNLFKDPKVRQALGLAFDFDWTNRSLFYSQYVRSDSYFSNSYLAARDLPSAEEQALLLPYSDKIPEDVFKKPLQAPETKDRQALRSNLLKALELLEQSGWTVQNGQLTNRKGEFFTFEILLVNQSFERVMAGYVQNLKKIGIQARYRTIDPALYNERIESFDFDMCVFVFGQSQSPGNEQRNYWSSSAADRQGSRNIAGIKDPVVDFLVDRIIYADNRDSLTTACRALDRVLWYGYYVVPNWYLDSFRIAYHDKFLRPDTLPEFYDNFSLLMTWWQGN